MDPEVQTKNPDSGGLLKLTPFEMERWQSTYENRVDLNLSESGVHPMTPRELLTLAESDLDISDIRLLYGQSNGSDELRARIAAMYPGATSDSILVTVGGAEANFTSFWHLLEPGVPAAVVLPTYGQVPGLLENFGAPVLPVHLDESTGWQPRLDELDDALKAGAKFILVTNPSNPTGAVLSKESMDGIAELAAKYDAWILSDEAYQGAELDGPITPSFWRMHDKVLVTNTVSKAYGLPGLRLGWIVGPDALVTELWGRTDYTTISPSTLSDALAVIALDPEVRLKIRARTKEILNRNLGVTMDWLDSKANLFSYRPPDAGAICYTRYNAPINSSELAERLRVEKSLLVVPGDHFGMDHYLRIGFGIPEPELLESLARLGEMFEEI